MKRLAWLCVLILIALSGCGSFQTLLALNRDTDNFVALKNDPRILFEPEAHSTALNISEDLDKVIEQIEQSHLRSFTQPVRIHICATDICMQRFGAPSTQVAGFVLNKRLFISASGRPSHEGLMAVLTHELSHLHLSQQLEFFAFAQLPTWFKEGHAVNASDGAGAERVKPAAAYHAIKQGYHFVPTSHDSLLFPTTASDYGLKPHMFYRQSALFLQYLRQSAPERYPTFLHAIQDGESFEESFMRVYNGTLENYWRQFVSTT